MNIYEDKLDKHKKAITKCQQEKNLNSCYSCDKTFSCKTKRDYIRSVYENMSEGRIGDFDF